MKTNYARIIPCKYKLLQENQQKKVEQKKEDIQLEFKSFGFLSEKYQIIELQQLENCFLVFTNLGSVFLRFLNQTAFETLFYYNLAKKLNFQTQEFILLNCSEKQHRKLIYQLEKFYFEKFNEILAKKEIMNNPFVIMHKYFDKIEFQLEKLLIEDYFNPYNPLGRTRSIQLGQRIFFYFLTNFNFEKIQQFYKGILFPNNKNQLLSFSIDVEIRKNFNNSDQQQINNFFYFLEKIFFEMELIELNKKNPNEEDKICSLDEILSSFYQFFMFKLKPISQFNVQLGIITSIYKMTRFTQDKIEKIRQKIFTQQVDFRQFLLTQYQKQNFNAFDLFYNKLINLTIKFEKTIKFVNQITMDQYSTIPSSFENLDEIQVTEKQIVEEPKFIEKQKEENLNTNFLNEKLFEYFDIKFKQKLNYSY